MPDEHTTEDLGSADRVQRSRIGNELGHLILTLMPSESIYFDGPVVSIGVVAFRGNAVRMSIVAPLTTHISRVDEFTLPENPLPQES